MIVKMSKVEIVGEKTLLQDVLSLLRELRIFHIEPATVGFIEKGHEDDIRAFSPDEKTAVERLFLEDLRLKIEELFSCLPKTPVRKSYIEPLAIIDVISKTIQKHTVRAADLAQRRDALQKERSDLSRYSIFLGTLTTLLGTTLETPDLDFIGLTIQDPTMVDRLREAISRITDWRYGLITETAEDGSLVGLITVEKEVADRVKKSLSDEHVPELTFPPSFSGLSFLEKVTYVNNRIGEVTAEIQVIDEEMDCFARRWIPIYQKVKEWIDDRLALITTTASAFETRLCFFINGWMPSRDIEKLGKRLTAAFGERVLLEEKEIHEEDMERIPIILQNPPYFKPFEVFTRLLPLPAYTSYDPTPFIGIFFPVFFGMILGDAGYGLLLAIGSFFLMMKSRRTGAVRDAAHILLICSGYAVFFGILFGEFFGELPHHLFGLKPLWVDRRTAVIPMIYFTLAVGTTHIVLGFLLGAIAAFKKNELKEAVHKLLSIALILSLIAVLASFFGFLPELLKRPVIIGILFLIPFLFFTGGLLAPLEFLKSVGNIISYVRIMAIGLTSVLLAYVANQLAGLIGNIVVGIAVAGLLHLLNIILGVFSPTIHSLRLHYVEFFSKFIEHGGRKFEPLNRTL
ncbi:MAG: V-type ATP synthase subunit I [bacterium]